MKIPVSKPHLWENECKYVNEALQEGWISSQGKFIDEFEKEFARFTGCKYAVSVSNGTNALHLALDILGFSEGDEVIVPDFTMMAPVFAIVQLRCVPVFVDVNRTWNIDPTKIEEKITHKTKAILVVHNYGHPSDMVAIKAICVKYNLLLIEDCAEAIGATVRGQMIGNWGDLSCYSFYANKIITTGEGGMVTTDNKRLYELARSKRNMSFGSGDLPRFMHGAVGYNYRMTNIQAAIGLAQLEHIYEAINRKIEIAHAYREELSDTPGIVLPPNEPWAKNVYWVFGIVVTNEFPCSRDNLESVLRSHDIETRRFFTPGHDQPFLKDHKHKIEGEFPNSTTLHLNGLYLPSYAELTRSDIVRICTLIKLIR